MILTKKMTISAANSSFAGGCYFTHLTPLRNSDNMLVFISPCFRGWSRVEWKDALSVFISIHRGNERRVTDWRKLS